MISFFSLISGSSGNASFISDGSTNLLIDCGMSGSRLKESLNCIGLTPDALDGVLITHEHSDHVKGVGVIARRYGLNLYGTEETLCTMEVGRVEEEQLNPMRPGEAFEIGSIGIRPFSIPHDAANPVGYNFFIENQKLSLATDMGHMNQELFDQIAGSRMILLESNHDVEMLQIGSYPYYLKQRILGSHGHLSNEIAAKTAYELIRSGTEHIMLGHLSQENNLPEIARMTTENLLSQQGVQVGKDMTLHVANRYQVTAFA